MTPDKQTPLGQLSQDAKRLLVIHGIDGYEDQGAYINASVGMVSLHCHARHGLRVSLGLLDGGSVLVYSETNVGDCTARYDPLMPEVMKIMRTALVLDDLANV